MNGRLELPNIRSHEGRRRRRRDRKSTSSHHHHHHHHHKPLPTLSKYRVDEQRATKASDARYCAPQHELRICQNKMREVQEQIETNLLRMEVTSDLFQTEVDEVERMMEGLVQTHTGIRVMYHNLIHTRARSIQSTYRRHRARSMVRFHRAANVIKRCVGQAAYLARRRRVKSTRASSVRVWHDVDADVSG